jgi:hypothetical protein
MQYPQDLQYSWSIFILPFAFICVIFKYSKNNPSFYCLTHNEINQAIIFAQDIAKNPPSDKIDSLSELSGD